MRKYLPQKKITYFMVVCALLVFGIWGIYKFLFESSSISSANNSASQLVVQTNPDDIDTDDLLTKSSAGDGIPDWEKALWGLDPKTTTAPDGTPDAEYIKNKQDELKNAAGTSTDQSATTNTDTDDSSSDLTETDKFARQFFATFLALKQSGQVDSTTIDNLSGALGQNIVNPDLPDKYSETDITTADDGQDSDQDYYTQVQNLFASYKNTQIGQEITIVAGVIGDDSATLDQKTEAEAELDSIADAYQDFAQKLISIPTPSDLVSYELEIANNAYNTGLSVQNLSKAIDDPILGLSGLSQYQKYSDALVSSATNLKTYLSTAPSADTSSDNSDIINQ